MSGTFSTGSAGDREALRSTFESVAARYHAARPDYPEALFDALAELAGLKAGDHLLEVGGATGKATLPLARRGFRITVVELGADLAAELLSTREGRAIWAHAGGTGAGPSAGPSAGTPPAGTPPGKGRGGAP